MVTIGRIAKIHVGAGLIWFTSVDIVSQTEELNFGAVFAMVLAFWVTTSLIQVSLCVRFSEKKEGDQRFEIGTIFLVVSYIAIYLVPIRLVVKEITRNTPEMSLSYWVPIILFLIVACVVISVIQLVVAEAIVSLLLATRKMRRSNRP